MSSSSNSPAPARPKRKRTVEDHVDGDSEISSSELQSGGSDIPVEEEDNLPVLSHAAKRKQKREGSKPQHKGDDSSAPQKKRKLKDGTAVPTMIRLSNDKTLSGSGTCPSRQQKKT